MFDDRELCVRCSTAKLPLFRSVCLVLFFFVALHSLVAGEQPPSSAPRNIIHEFWSFKDGAPETVRAIAQTSDGYLWLGSSSGLYRFDGVRFELFRGASGTQLPSNNVSALFAPPSGGLWVGHVFGGFSFIQHDKATNYVDLPPPGTGTVQAFAQDRNGVVWAATYGGVWRFTGTSWEQNANGWDPKEVRVAQVGFDRDGILWVLTDNPSVQFGRRLYYLLPGAAKFEKAAENILIQSFTWDSNHNVVTTRQKPLVSSEFNFASSLPSYPILRKNSEQIIDGSNVWFLLASDPFVLRRSAVEPLAETVGTASRDNSEVFDINSYRYSRLVDREGSVWIGEPKGVHRFSYSPLMRPELPKADGPHFTVAADDGGVVWISAGNGTGSSILYRVVNGKADLQQPQGGLTQFAYRAPDKTLWFGGEGGLWHLVAGHLSRVELPAEQADNAHGMTTITQDRSGAVWVSFGPVGCYRWKNGVWEKSGGRGDFPQFGVLIAYTDIQGRIWFGSTRNRLAVFDGDRFKQFGSKDGLHVGNVTAIHGRGTQLWIGGEMGLQQLDGAGQFHTIQTIDSSSLRGISGIVETENGDLWLNGLGGIVHLRSAELQRALKEPAYQASSERFDRREGLPGLPSQLARMPTAIQGTDGRLWFSVNNGVVWLDPNQISNKATPPALSVQSLVADGKGYALDQTLRLPAHTSSVEIHYAAVSLLSPEAIRYRYKLQGVDKDWHDAGTSTSVSYRTLSPGSYNFQVNASDTNGMWTDNEARVDFALLPAFYQTNWFRGVCALMLLGIVWTAHQLRIRRVQYQFEITLNARVGERTRIARELHDTLLQSFHGLLLRFQAGINLLPGRPTEARKVLEDAVEQASQAITEGRDAIRGLRMSTIEKNDLALAIRTIGEELASAESKRPAPNFEVVVEGTSRNLHPILRDEVYRLATEALRNAFKHAAARTVEVEIHYDEKNFRLRIRDDGKGIDSEVLLRDGREGHYGLHGMRERAKLVGGKLTIWTELDSGTEIELVIPGAKVYAKSTQSFWHFGKRSAAETDEKETIERE